MNGISIIIPTLNRTDFLQQTVDCLLKQEFKYPYEILIIDQSEKEDGLMLIYQKSYSIIRYYYISFFRGLPEARNFGWQHAKYDYILYIDDDIICDSNLLEEHYKFISKEDIGIVAGGITEKYKENPKCKIGRFNYITANPNRGFHQKENGFVDHAGGGNFSVKKNVLEKVGGIDENLTKGAALYEETDFCLRAGNIGYKIFFNYNAHVYHLAAQTGGCRIEDIDKYIFNMSRNKCIIIKRHLKWYHKITAYGYLIKLILAYTISYRKISLLSTSLKGMIEGNKIE